MTEDKSPASAPYEVTLNIPSMASEADVTSISLRDIVNTIRKKSVFVLAMLLIFSAIGAVAAFSYYFFTRSQPGNAVALISYGYKEAENGNDPLGRPLDVSKIKAPYVIDQAMEEFGLYELGMTVEDVRSSVVIEGVLPDNVMERILIIKEIATKDPTKLEAIAELQYHPTQYIVTLEHSKGLKKLSQQQLSDLLSSILTYYSQYFMEEYSDRSVFPTIAENFDQSRYDYAEVVQILNMQISNMITYCQVKEQASPEFRSPTTQKTFGDIINNLELIKSVDLSRISALVYAGNMSRDKNRLIKIYEYNIETKKMERETALENARAANELAEAYQKDTVMVMGLSGESTQMSQSSGTYDKFLQDTLSNLGRANDLLQEIQFYEDKLANLKSPFYPSNVADIPVVEDAIVAVLEIVQDWSDITNQTVEDYIILDAFKDATKVVIPAHYTKDTGASLLIMVAIFGVAVCIGLFIGLMGAIWKEAFPVGE